MFLPPTRLSSIQAITVVALCAGSVSFVCRPVGAQVFVVGEKTATADVSTDFKPTRIQLPTTPITERGRRDLIRNLEAEQGFAHRPLPLGTNLTLLANGNLTPGGDEYKAMLYKKGQFAAAGDRVAITAVVIRNDRIEIDLNGGPHLKHRFLRHVEIGDNPLVPDDGAQVSGCRVTLMFEGGLPEVSAPEVKALLDPLIDFGVKSSIQAYADTLPAFLKDAIAHHDVLVGMDRKMVLASLGPPASKTRELLEGSTDRHYEEWIYGQVPQTVRFVRFQGERVTQVRIAQLGQPIAIHDRDEMNGYYDNGDPSARREIAMGDGSPSEGDGTHSAKPTILKPGEAAPGAEQRVRLPQPDLAPPSDTAPPSDSTPAPAAGTVPAHPDGSAPAPSQRLVAASR
jgi:hypothetical protein